MDLQNVEGAVQLSDEVASVCRRADLAAAAAAYMDHGLVYDTDRGSEDRDANKRRLASDTCTWQPWSDLGQSFAEGFMLHEGVLVYAWITD